MINIRKNYLNGTPKTQTELYNGKNWGEIEKR